MADFLAQLLAFSTSGLGIFVTIVFAIVAVCAVGATVYQVVAFAVAAGFRPGRAFRSIWTLPIVIVATWLPFGPPWWAALLVVIAWLVAHWVHDRETTETALTAIGRIVADLGAFLFDFVRGAIAPQPASAQPQNAAPPVGAAAFAEFGDHVSFPRPMPLMPAAKGASLTINLTLLLAALAAFVGLAGWLVFGLMNKGEEAAEARHETVIAQANQRTEKGRADFNSDLAEETDTYHRRDRAIHEEAERGRDEIRAAADAAGKFAAYRAAVERMRNAADAAHAGAVQDFVSSVGA